MKCYKLLVLGMMVKQDKGKFRVSKLSKETANLSSNEYFHKQFNDNGKITPFLLLTKEQKTLSLYKRLNDTAKSVLQIRVGKRYY